MIRRWGGLVGGTNPQAAALGFGGKAHCARWAVEARGVGHGGSAAQKSGAGWASAAGWAARPMGKVRVWEVAGWPRRAGTHT
jgi:hypothetical protein